MFAPKKAGFRLEYHSAGARNSVNRLLLVRFTLHYIYLVFCDAFTLAKAQ
jgi:hypothetical protein